MTDEVRQHAIAFEAVKTSLNQTKDGIVLRLAIHPNDVPRQLMTDWVGSRYQVAMVKLGDDDQPEVSPDALRAERAVQSAGMLCRNEAFQKFIEDIGYGGPTEDVREPERWAAAAIREFTGVTSRAEFKDSPEAIKRFYELTNEFEAWRNQNPHDAKTERRGHDD